MMVAKRPSLLLGSLLLLALTAACAPEPGSALSGEPAESTPELTGDTLRVEDAHAIQVPGGGTGAVYLRVVNPTDRDDLLEAVATPAAKVAEVHETVKEGSLVRMRAFPEGMPVPARSVVILEPEGKHVMLMALEKILEPGEEIELELRFREAGPLLVTVPVIDIGS